MSIEIKSPTFPESVADGTVANWVKKEGESVEQDEVIAEIETDKVVLEVVAPVSGTITKIVKQEGEIVNSSELIAEFNEGDSEHAKPEISEGSSEPKFQEPETNKLGPAAKRIIAEENIDPSEAETFLSVGLCPVGAITRVEDFYRNLDTRIISGFDLGVDYNFSSRFGFFNISVNATKIDKFIQKAGPDVSELLDAQKQGIIPSEFSIQGFSDLLNKDGSPEIQANLKLLWQLDSWGAGLFVKHTGDFVQTRVRAKDGEYWKIDEYNKVSGYLDYTINKNSKQTRLRFGINNIFDERAPLSSDIFGYYFDLHDNLGRYYYFDIKYNF